MNDLSLTRMFLRGRLALFVLCATVVAGPALANPPDDAPRLDENAPLGSHSNPVKASMPLGEHDYLMRLRCPAGDAPAFVRSGSMGTGVHGNIVDGYKVTCADGAVFNIVMDMYHRHREMRPVPGLAVLPEHPARLAAGCPPQVPGSAPGAYVFHLLEVETPARAVDLQREFINAPFDGNAAAEFVIGPDGKVRMDTVQFAYPPRPPEFGTLVTQALAEARFEPAQHRPGCAVAQHTGARFAAKVAAR